MSRGRHAVITKFPRASGLLQMPAVTKDSVRILGTKLQVVQGDLTTIQADCIVNAANEQLDLRDGLAKAIADAGAV